MSVKNPGELLELIGIVAELRRRLQKPCCLSHVATALLLLPHMEDALKKETEAVTASLEAPLGATAGEPS